MARLTRSQVAQRLGRSIATVRRLEQEGALVPQLGPGHVRFFHSLDVDRLSDRAGKSGRFLSGSAIRTEPSDASGVDAIARSTLDNIDLDLETNCKRLAASHCALRDNMTDLLGKLLDVLHPRSTDAIEVIEEMLELLASENDPRD